MIQQTYVLLTNNIYKMKTFLFLFLFSFTSIFSQVKINLTLTDNPQSDTLIFVKFNDIINGIQLNIPNTDTLKGNKHNSIIEEYTMIAYNEAGENNKFFLTHGQIKNEDDYNEYFRDGLKKVTYKNYYTNLFFPDLSLNFNSMTLIHFIKYGSTNINIKKKLIVFKVVKIVIE